MQDLFNVRGYLARWEQLKGIIENREERERIAKEAVEDINSRLDNITVLQPEPLSEQELTQALAANEAKKELIEELIPALQNSVDQLTLTAASLRKKFSECEAQCAPPEERKELISLPENDFTADPDLPFNWKGPYYEVCEACRKLAARLNELYGIDNANEVNAVNGKLAALRAQIFTIKTKSETSDSERKKYSKELKQLRREEKDAEKVQKRALSNQQKIIKNFNETLAKYQECINKCPPQKKACVFPEELFSSMTIGPNNEVGSSAQAAKEMRDKVTGAAKGAATKAVGNLLGFGGFGGGGSKGPKTDKDRTRGDFTRISSGDTDLDIRAGWHDDQLIVSTEIDESPDNGTFHAQWIEDKDGKTYLPVRYMIFKMYRDWKLTVSWTEDHYVNGDQRG